MGLREENKSVMRERILGVARRLFYAQGIQAVGVDMIAADAGISKRTLYDYFASKSELVRAYLEGWSQPAHASDLPPLERILAEFDLLERSFARSTYRGCPFINAVAEAAPPADAVRELAVRFKEGQRSWFRAQLAELEVADPDGLAAQLMLLVDGAIAAMLVRGNKRIARTARDAAATLLAAAAKR